MHPVHPMQPFAIPDDWNAEQAMAVVDLLDELRERIWDRYALALHEAYREQYQSEPLDDDLLSPEDKVDPF